VLSTHVCVRLHPVDTDRLWYHSLAPDTLGFWHSVLLCCVVCVGQTLASNSVVKEGIFGKGRW
jgi:hypothetical protein